MQPDMMILIFLDNSLNFLYFYFFLVFVLLCFDFFICLRHIGQIFFSIFRVTKFLKRNCYLFLLILSVMYFFLQFFTERIQQLVLLKHMHMLRWNRFCEHTSTIESLYPVYNQRLTYVLMYKQNDYAVFHDHTDVTFGGGGGDKIKNKSSKQIHMVS